MIQKPRGTADILPEEALLWQRVEAAARECAALYGFGEIRLPTFEATELFQRGVGDTTDVVQKEMYTFTDREERSFTLRPEGTAGVVRAIIENGKCGDTMPMKLFYLINCFRYEKPQAGRSREFYQFGTEMFGAPSPAADAEMISLANAFISSLGISEVSLHINSIGCPKCRPSYHAALKEYFTAHSDELCETCRGRLETNPMRILDCKSEICSKIAVDAPKTIDYLCEDCSSHMEKLKRYLTESGLEYEIDTRIVRGLDYYTKTVFEFISPIIGAQSTICGGGRYDGLVKELGGPELCGIGFAAGISRLILAMKASGNDNFKPESPRLYIASMGEEAAAYSVRTVNLLRKHGIYAEGDPVGRSLKAQMKYADKKNAAYTLIIGDSELETGRAQIKNMTNSTQTEININDIDALCATLTEEK